MIVIRGKGIYRCPLAGFGSRIRGVVYEREAPPLGGDRKGGLREIYLISSRYFLFCSMKRSIASSQADVMGVFSNLSIAIALNIFNFFSDTLKFTGTFFSSLSFMIVTHVASHKKLIFSINIIKN
ncbi:unknown [Methanobacterium phage psiM2]|uniref:Uncharacterized protein n=1 Tax=Methanobacterium phage psiM2 TaxID=77048 RepID=O80219_METM2|nr:hypothetical protein psiM2p31 [Methanobacterium phage psiM2]AAC27069.1 unknown [Methanobacterium phage psiM2]